MRNTALEHLHSKGQQEITTGSVKGLAGNAKGPRGRNIQREDWLQSEPGVFCLFVCLLFKASGLCLYIYIFIFCFFYPRVWLIFFLSLAGLSLPPAASVIYRCCET